MSETNASFAEIAAAIRGARRIAVLSHLRPDGDALGSQLAFGLAVRALGKEVAIWNEDGMLEKYRFMPCAELLVRPPQTPEDFDLGVALDTAVQNRLGSAFEVVRAPRWINLDHHPTNPRYGDLNYIDPIAPATGQILFE
ncbi:MAG: DHH family phosphoesterase, partial [Verrucomicrobiota bacterium]|nr:DHH family phosphoesterase [Verrucomicrobiota bacterium]